MVYMNMRSLDLRDVANVNLYGNLAEQRLSHVDTLQVLLKLGWRVTVGDLLDKELEVHHPDNLADRALLAH